ncbi:MAG: exo-alpha-sialidase [Candidatus Competibacteraceae bacterium]|nr:exo-alpha-sialidase [Candidatus Competibacteraceae bacterium]
MSRDAGVTWEQLRVIEHGPSGYSDLMALPDATLLCVFECGMIETHSDTRTIAVCRFSLTPA